MVETSRLPKLLKEPLVHFLAGAFLVFGFFWATGSNRDPADYVISIGETDIARFKARWIQNFRREPSSGEMDGLIDQAIKEEIYYREALRLGLDRNDPVVRRRLATKMRFLSNANDDGDQPSDAQLQKWMDDHPEKYAGSAVYDLEQIYLGQGDDVDPKRVTQWIAGLNSDAIQKEDIAKPLSVPPQIRNAETSEISRQFGEKFSAAIASLEVGNWSGPVASGFGSHIVKIRSKIPGKSLSLELARQAVTNDWRADRTAKLEKAALDAYREQYDVRVAGRP